MKRTKTKPKNNNFFANFGSTDSTPEGGDHPGIPKLAKQPSPQLVPAL